MGTQFFFFYDILLLVLAIGIIIKCSKKGFISTLVSFLAVFIAFLVALPTSSVLADIVYDNVVEEKLAESIQTTFDQSLDGTVIAEINSVDMSKAVINGKSVTEITPEVDTAGYYSLKIESADFSATGISSADLTAFGIEKDTDFTALNLGSVEISQVELEKYGLEKMLLVNYLAREMTDGTIFGTVCGITDKISEVLPETMNGFSRSVNDGNVETLKDIVLCIVDVDTGSFSRSLLDNVVKPVFLVPLRALIFIVLFVIILVLLNVIARAMKVVNKIPFIGGINSLLGAVFGVLEAAVVILLVCIGIQVLVTITDNSLVFLNTMTVDKTFIFKNIYYFNFLDFLK